MSSDNVVKRRPTRQIQKALELAENNYLSLQRSQRYAERSMSRNSRKWFSSLREIEVAAWVWITTLKWVLGVGLNDEEQKRTLVETDDAENC